MTILAFIVVLGLFFYYKRRLQQRRMEHCLEERVRGAFDGAVSWHDQWHKQWADKFERQAKVRLRHLERHAERRFRNLSRRAERMGFRLVRSGREDDAAASLPPAVSREEAGVMRRARRRARAEVAFYTHVMVYLGALAFLTVINMMTTAYPWFVWPAIGWGIGLFAHYMAVFGGRLVRERYFEPAVDREVRREKISMHTEKQASIDELSATIAHEIRNPIAAAKSLVQQVGEDPGAAENAEYVKVALAELDRVERSVSHLLKYAKEEDYSFAPVDLAAVVDSAVTQMNAKLNAARVHVERRYECAPTVVADAEKLRQVFANVLDNAADALACATDGRRIVLVIENGDRGALPGAAPRPMATVRVRDNGCGVPADKVERIFNPFFTTKEQGTGLGMAIAKKIVEAHDGSIDVASQAGEGTEFVVTLPRAGKGAAQ